MANQKEVKIQTEILPDSGKAKISVKSPCQDTGLTVENDWIRRFKEKKAELRLDPFHGLSWKTEDEL